jgi:hypothetical protein
MDTLMRQLPLIAFLVFYYFYGARLVGTLMAAAWRPIRGLEARPMYWEGGIAALFPGLGLWQIWQTPHLAAWIYLLFAAVGAFMLLDWSTRLLWLADGALHARGTWGKGLILPLSEIRAAQIGGGLSLVIERRDGGQAIRAPLSMDGLDGLYAALLRAGVPGPSFDDFQAARVRHRRR